MSYEPTIWSSGDIVTAAKLNKLENGVADKNPCFEPGAGSESIQALAANDGGTIRQPNASGENALALGISTTASGKASVAAGQNSIASGRSSFAFGEKTTGKDPTTASGLMSFAFGLSSTASGGLAIAGGQLSEANATASVAIGNGVKATGRTSVVIGQYNVPDDNPVDTSHGSGARKYLLTVGNGTADNARSNALTVDWSGNLVTSGTLTIGSTTVTEAQLISLLALLN